MSCKEVEKEIYLYRELTDAERKLVDTHIQTCTACEELLQVVLSTQTLIAKASIKKPELANHGRLTSNIMQAIQGKPQASIFVALLQQSFVKYSFVAASLVLVILFVTEQQTFIEPEKPVISGTVTLKSASIANVLDKKTKPEVSLYACIKSENCNNPLVENLKQKNF